MLVVPIAVLLLGLGVRAIQGPHSLAQNFDPDYAYLFNALNALELKAPGHTDHPGTPLQVLAAGVLAVRNAATAGSDDAATQVIGAPDAALAAVNLALLAVLAVCLWLSGYLALRGGLKPAAALMLQGGVLLFPVAIPFLARVSPEILLLGTTPLMTVLLLAEGRKGQAIAAGVVYALSVTLKVIAFPVVSLALLLRTRTGRLWFAAAAMVSAAVFLLPAWPRFQGMATWFTAVLTRSGTYGSGELGLPPLASLVASARHLVEQEPFFVVWPVFALVSSWRTAEPRRPLYVAVAGIAIQFALVSKHPEPRYLLPSFTLAALCAALAFESARGRRLWILTWWVVLGANVVFSANETRIWASAQLEFREKLAALNEVAAKHPECMKAGVYRSSLATNSLMFGDHYSAFHHANKLRMLYPETMELYMSDGGFHSFHGETVTQRVVDRLRAGGCLLVQGTEFRNARLPASQNWAVERLAGTGPAPMAALGESLYLIRLNGATASSGTR